MLKHVAFIMDGNRRWAKKRHLPLIAGHTKGYQVIEPLIIYAVKREIKYLTFWAFSTENWNRDKKEVMLLMRIFRQIFQGNLINRLHKNGARIQIIGEFAAFPKDIVDDIKAAVEKTKNNTVITVNIGLNYGGRAEILQAVNRLLDSYLSYSIQAKMADKMEVGEDQFSSFLYTKDQPDPDFIIRTSGEKRLSGFLPWQSAYSELYFPEVLWPDFNEMEFEKAISEFEKRKRRFGA